MAETMEIYKAVNAVQSALAKTGIGKDRQASGGGASYKFRGIDDVYSHLAPLLAEHGLCVFPRCLTREMTERATRSGGALFVAVVHAEFDFVAVADGSKHTVSTYGEAMDSSDKATNKAMSAAFKYAAFITFCIPTEGDNDADATGHDVTSRFIDASQISDLQGMIEGYGLNLAKILQHYKIKSFTEIPADEFANVTAQLNRWNDAAIKKREAAQQETV
jgi:hypothetical protein